MHSYSAAKMATHLDVLLSFLNTTVGCHTTTDRTTTTKKLHTKSRYIIYIHIVHDSIHSYSA